MADDPAFRLPVRSDDGGFAIDAPPSFVLDVFAGSSLVATYAVRGEGKSPQLQDARRLQARTVTIDGLPRDAQVVGEIVLAAIRPLGDFDAPQGVEPGRAVILPAPNTTRFEIRAEPEVPVDLRFRLLGEPEGRSLRRAAAHEAGLREVERDGSRPADPGGGGK